MMDGAYIDGRWRPGTGTRFQNHCPASGDVVWDGQGAGAEQVIEAVAFARSAIAHWAYLPQGDRTRVLVRYAD